MKKIIALVAILGLSSMAMADAYTKCVSCHGANGEKSALNKSKIMSDMTKAEIVAAIHGYKDGTYGGPMKGLMKGQVASLTDADITAIAEKVGK
ncbi:c-type cytochrome [bacterium]|nr:c-type cytochrome [bacterium]MBU1994042.1 c-type cytochrome [bacterium]